MFCMSEFGRGTNGSSKKIFCLLSSSRANSKRHTVLGFEANRSRHRDGTLLCFQKHHGVTEITWVQILFTSSGCSAKAANKSVHRTCPCAPSPSVFPPLVSLCLFVCLFVCSSWCVGSACVWQIHTDHPPVERLVSVGAFVVAVLVKATFQSKLLCRACRAEVAASGCAVMVTLPHTAPHVPPTKIDPPQKLQQISEVAVSFRGSARRSRRVPLSSVS